MDCIHVAIIDVIWTNVDFLMLEPQFSPCAQFKICRNTSNTNWLVCNCNVKPSDPINTENFFVRYIHNFELLKVESLQWHFLLLYIVFLVIVYDKSNVLGLLCIAIICSLAKMLFCLLIRVFQCYTRYWFSVTFHCICQFTASYGVRFFCFAILLTSLSYFILGFPLLFLPSSSRAVTSCTVVQFVPFTK